MKVILVWRPEAVTNSSLTPSPFDGIEILTVAMTDEDAIRIIEDLIKDPTTNTKGWKFHVDQL